MFVCFFYLLFFLVPRLAPEPSAKSPRQHPGEINIQIDFCSLSLAPNPQKLHGKTTSRQKPAHDRKRNFIRTDLAVDTEGR